LPVKDNHHIEKVKENVVKLVSHVTNSSFDSSELQNMRIVRKSDPASKIKSIVSVKLKSFDSFNLILKNKKNFDSKIFENQKGKVQKIFVNNSLTYFYRNLLRKTKEKAHNLNYKFVWYKNFNVFVREKEGEEIIQIGCLMDLDKLSKPIVV